MGFKDEEVYFDGGLAFSEKALGFLDRKGHELFKEEDNPEQESDFGNAKRRLIRKLFSERYDRRRRGRNSVFQGYADHRQNKEEGDIYEWQVEQRHSSYDETEKRKERIYENAWTEQAAGRGGLPQNGQGEAQKGYHREAAAKKAGSHDGRDAAGIKKSPAADPAVRKEAQKAQVARLISQGKLKGTENAGSVSFWGFGQGVSDSKKETAPNEKGPLALLLSVAATDLTIVVLLMILFLSLLPVTLGMFVSIHMVSASVERLMGVFSGRGSIISEGSLTEEEINEIVAGSGATGSQEAVIRFALSRVGCAYSQTARGSGGAYDCSSLAYYAWQAAGVDISYGGGYPPTAAVEASRIYTNGTVVSSTTTDGDPMQPGDLIFYGGHDNGRYLGIYHVAIYVGNGQVVEALNQQHGVVYGTIRTRNVILVLRPV